MKTTLIVLIAAAAVILILKFLFWMLKGRVKWGGSAEEPMFYVSEDSEAMRTACEKARATVDQFILALSGQNIRGSVKVKVEDNQKNEFMWLDELHYSEGIFTGVINNDPQHVKNVKLGDPWKIAKEDIHDWLYMKNGKLYGNFSFKAAIQKWPKEKQVIALKDYGDAEELACEFVRESVPFLSAMAKNMTYEDMEAFVRKANIPEEKKQELFRKLKEKAEQQGHKS